MQHREDLPSLSPLVESVPSPVNHNVMKQQEIVVGDVAPAGGEREAHQMNSNHLFVADLAHLVLQLVCNCVPPASSWHGCQGARLQLQSLTEPSK